MLFGLIALSITGLSWSLFGIVMGSAPKRGVDASFVQFFSGVVSILANGLLLWLIRPEWNSSMYIALLCYGVSGMLNFLLLQLMSIAMQSGPNGIIYGIVQSGVVFPFMMGILFFNVPRPPARISGMVLLIIALFLFGIAKGSGVSVGEVNSFLKKFDKTRLMMKKVSKNKKYQSDLMSRFGS